MTRFAHLSVAGLAVLAATIILVPSNLAGQSYRPVTDARLVSPEPENRSLSTRMRHLGESIREQSPV